MRLYWRLLGFLRPHFKAVIIAAVFLVLFTGLSGISLTVIVPLADLVFTPPTGNAGPPSTGALQTPSSQWMVFLPSFAREKVAGILQGGDRLNNLRNLCVLILMIFLFKNLFEYFQRYFSAQVEQAALMDIRNRIYEHYQRLSLDYFQGKRGGQLISRIINDLPLVKGAITYGLLELLKQATLLLVYLFLVFWANWKLAMISLLILPAGLLLIAQIGRRIKGKSTLTQDRQGILTSTLQESIYGIRVIKAFAMEKFELLKFEGQSRDVYKASMRMMRLGFISPALTETFAVLAGVTILWVGGHEILAGTGMSAGTFLLFLVAMFSLMQPVKKLSNMNLDIQQGLAAAQRIFEVIDTEPKLKPSRSNLRVEKPQNEIAFDRVSFKYEGKKSVLNGVTFRVRAGDIIALVGPSGAGKSTLMDLLIRFYDPDEGRILIDEYDLRDIDISSLRQMMGIVSQETLLFNDTVWNNIAYGHSGASNQAVERAALLANAHSFISSMPLGYQTIIGDRGLKLSGGERQRLAIARALFKDPQILIFDEATSALDSQSEILVQEAMNRLIKDRTCFVIAHRLSTVKHANLIVVLDKGRVVQIGKHEDLVDQEGLYKKLYQLQFRL